MEIDENIIWSSISSFWIENEYEMNMKWLILFKYLFAKWLKTKTNSF